MSPPVQPAVGVDGGRSRLPCRPDTHHDVRPGRSNTRRPQCNSNGERPPASSQTVTASSFGAAHRPHPAGPSASPQTCRRSARCVDVVRLHAHQHHRHGGRTGDREPQRAQVEVCGPGDPAGSVDGRRARQHGDAVVLDTAKACSGSNVTCGSAWHRSAGRPGCQPCSRSCGRTHR